MKQSILDMPLSDFEATLKRNVLYCSLAVVALLCVNVGVCFLWTEKRHTFLLLFNILSDILCAGAVIYRAETYISPRKSLLRLMKKPARTYTAEVWEVSENTHRIPGLDCNVIRTEQRVFYLPRTEMIRLETGKTYTFRVVDNVILEVTA